MTDFHSYNEPDQGQARWHVPLNENFREIDADIEIRDTAANRGDYEPKDGAKYFETDTGDIYLGDGTNWNRQSIASGAETSVSDDGNEVVRDVTDIDLTDGYFDVTNPGGSAVDVSITDDSIDTLAIDLSITPTWTGQHQFDAGLDTRGDVVDDTTTVWDSTNNYVPQTSLENDSLAVGSGNGLAGGGNIALGGSTTLAVDASQKFEGSEGGEIQNSDQGLVETEALSDGRTARVDSATLVKTANSTVGAVPSNVTLELVTFEGTGYTTRATLISGDGSTLHNTVSGDPLGGYENTSGGEQTVGVIIDNQSGDPFDVYAAFDGFR